VAIGLAAWIVAMSASFAESAAPRLEAKPVSFRNEVMAVLSRSGCNAGTCHGNKNGKGGFKLSLRGQDPDADYASLTRDQCSRRVNLLQPAESLMLVKPTGGVAHEGGIRFTLQSPEYELLRRWIAEGSPNDVATAARLTELKVEPRESVLVAPADQVQLRVWGRFSDGAKWDLGGLAVYEVAGSAATATPDGVVRRRADGEATVLVRYLGEQVPVRFAFVPERPGFRWRPTPSYNYIDDHVLKKLRTLRLHPAGLCSDAVFVRRAFLDLHGRLPTAEEGRAFVGDKRADKRARLVEDLLERPEFADFWALQWADLLRVEAHSLDQKGVQAFHHWIRQRVADHTPIDQFVRELITARGSTYAQPAANYYRPHRDPLSRGKAAAQVFLGTRLQCAECHNHPSDRWTQDDYYDWAALFARVSYKVVENNRVISSDEHEWNGEQIVFLSRQGEVRNPRTGQPARPRFLGQPSVTATNTPANQPSPPLDDPLTALAQWLTSPENSWFARVQANRIWRHLLGRGLVEPPDDFRATNPASHPELLEALADDLVRHDFDLRHLIRRIMAARTYQLAGEVDETNAGDVSNYSHAWPRRLEAEQLLDAQSQVTGTALSFAGYPKGLRAAQLPGVRPESLGQRRANPLDRFLETFGKPPRLLTTDTERSCECNMSQAFQMLSGPTVNELLAAKDNRLTRLLACGRPDLEIVQELFWAALSRPPTAAELGTLLPQLAAASDRRVELEDLTWGLLNSNEFLFRP
jgi:hypothetical protein